MIRKALVVITGIAAVIVFAASPAYAWTWGLSASTKCVEYQTRATFVLDNTAENEVATVRTSNHTDLVPVGTTIPKKGTLTKGPIVIKGTYTLTLEVNFPSDQLKRSRTVTVTKLPACVPPSTTTTTAPPTTTTTTTVPKPTTTTVPHTTTTTIPPTTTTTIPQTTTTLPSSTTTVPSTTVTTQPQPPELPKTGSNTTDLARLGFGLLCAGILLAVIRRRIG